VVGAIVGIIVCGCVVVIIYCVVTGKCGSSDGEEEEECEVEEVVEVETVTVVVENGPPQNQGYGGQPMQNQGYGGQQMQPGGMQM